MRYNKKAKGVFFYETECTYNMQPIWMDHFGNIYNLTPDK